MYSLSRVLFPCKTSSELLLLSCRNISRRVVQLQPEPLVVVKPDVRKKEKSPSPSSRKLLCDLCRSELLESEQSILDSLKPESKMTVTIEPSMINSETFPQLLTEIDTFIFDADGVLWLGEDAIPGSPELIDYLVNRNKNIIILTNNATKSRKLYSKKLENLGYNERITKNIVNPAAVVADTLNRSGIKQHKKKVYLIGSQGVKDELDILNIEYFGDGPDPIERQSDNGAFIYDLELDVNHDDVGAVVVGYEKHFNYHKLMKATNYLQSNNTLFIATNSDETCPGPNPNTIIPDAGPLIAAVKVASGREPLIVGKPYSPAYEYICRRWKINPNRTLMIGDRTNTDIKFGHDHGLRTMLVLSGCHQIDDIIDNQLNDRDDMIPDYYSESLGSLLPIRI